jgi:hypothetical protein
MDDLAGREIKVGNFALQVSVVVLGASHHTDFGSLLVLKLSCHRKNKANNQEQQQRSWLRNAANSRYFTS